MRKKRILTALNSSPESLSALKAAIGLAEKMEAELTGLYVEDINLLNLVYHPCAASLSPLGVKGAAFENDGLVEILLKMQGENARKALEAMAAAAGVVAIWETIRGRVCETLLAAASGADMLFLGWNDRLSPDFKLGSTAKFIAQNANVPVLLPRIGSSLEYNRIIIWDMNVDGVDNIRNKLVNMGFNNEYISVVTDYNWGVPNLNSGIIVAIAPKSIKYIDSLNSSLIVVP